LNNFLVECVTQGVAVVLIDMPEVLYRMQIGA